MTRFNFGTAGDFINTATSQETILNGDTGIGFHVGGHARLEFTKFYVLGETYFTLLHAALETVDYTLSKVDTPILLGVNIGKSLSLQAGPSFQFIVNNSLDNLNSLGSIITTEDLEPENRLTIGYQVGVRVQLEKFGIDLRYEGFFNDNRIPAVVTETSNLDLNTRPEQVLLSISYDFMDLFEFFGKKEEK